MYFYIDSSISSTDKVIIATSVDVLCEQGIITYSESVDICLASGHVKKKMLDDKLHTLCSETGDVYFTLVPNIFCYFDY